MPSLLRDLLTHAARDLETADARFAVVGGLAVAVRAMLRTTQDVDLAVAVANDQEAESIATVLIRYGYRPHAEIDQARTQRLATLRLISPHLPDEVPADESPLIDLLFASSGIEIETVDAADPTDVLEGAILPTARIPHLIAMKLLSESDQRLQDRIDLQHLTAAATDADLAEVPPLLELIAERGFHRDKNLPAVWDGFRAKR
jgi:hypothetical protein